MAVAFFRCFSGDLSAMAQVDGDRVRRDKRDALSAEVPYRIDETGGKRPVLGTDRSPEWLEEKLGTRPDDAHGFRGVVCESVVVGVVVSQFGLEDGKFDLVGPDGSEPACLVELALAFYELLGFAPFTLHLKS